MRSSTKISSFTPVLALLGLAFVVLVLSPASARAQQCEVTDQILLSDYDLADLDLNDVQVANDLDVRQESAVPHWQTMFTELPQDWYRGISLAPRIESIRPLATLSILTYSLTRVDNELWHDTRKFFRSSEIGREFMNYSVALGDGRTHLGIAAAFAGYGWLMGDSQALRAASQTVETFMATGVAVQLLKRVTGRESPAAATHRTGRWQFLPHFKQYQKHQTSYYAFPSGHISTAMGTLTVIAENYPQAGWIKPVGYTMVGALGMGLVAKGMHWYSDLPAGIGLGYLFGKIVSNPELSNITKISKEGAVDVSVAPGFDRQGGGRVSLAVVF